MALILSAYRGALPALLSASDWGEKVWRFSYIISLPFFRWGRGGADNLAHARGIMCAKEFFMPCESRSKKKRGYKDYE
jgi:hypothetical protein